jgi:hypothetical protein
MDRKLSALKPKAAPMPQWMMMKPPTAGPRKRARLKMPALSAMPPY